MLASGNKGGTPMLSKPGKASSNNFVCFSNGVKMKVEDEFELDPNVIPMHVIEEKLRLELNGHDESYIQAFVSKVKQQFTENEDVNK